MDIEEFTDHAETLAQDCKLISSELQGIATLLIDNGSEREVYDDEMDMEQKMAIARRCILSIASELQMKGAAVEGMCFDVTSGDD